jgi:hypothetical protein
MSTSRRFLRLAGPIVLLTASAFALGAEPPRDQEPPLLLYLESNGKRIPIELDKPFATETLAGTKTATLRAEPYRVFPYAGLSFRYPRGYSYEANLDDSGVSFWTMTGSNFVIMLQQFPGTRDHAAIRQTVTDGMIKSYGDAKARQLDTKLEVDGVILQGRRLEFTLAETLLHQELFSFNAGETSVVLILQDTPHETGKPSVDRINGEKLLRESLRLPAK